MKHVGEALPELVTFDRVSVEGGGRGQIVELTARFTAAIEAGDPQVAGGVGVVARALAAAAGGGDRGSVRQARIALVLGLAGWMS